MNSVLQEVCGSDTKLERLTSDARFTEQGKQRVVRYDLDARVAGAPYIQRYQWVGKFYEHEEDAERVAAALRAIAGEKLHGNRLAVPTVIAYHPPLHLLVLTYETGESVGSAIARDTDSILAAMGQTLAALHSLPVHSPTLTSPETLLADLKPRLEDLCAWRPAQAASFRQIFARIADEAPPLPTKLSFVHGDFGPANLLWRGGEIVVLDFDKCAKGDPALDLANLLVQLRRITIRKPWKLRDFGSIRPALLESYRRWRTTDDGWESRVAWYEQAITLRKVHRLLLEAKNNSSDLGSRPNSEADELMRVFLETPAGVSVSVESQGQSLPGLTVKETGSRTEENLRVEFPVDHEVPQLSVASNPQLMLDLFRRHLKPVPGKVYQIEDCAPFRFRCRQASSRHVLQYTVRVAEPRTGRRWDQSVTAILYPEGEAIKRWEAMKAELPERKIPQSCLTFDPVSFIPSLGMLLEVYPYDQKLRTLGPLVGGAVQSLDPPLLAQLGPGEWSVKERTIEPMRYRAEFGLALRYVIRARDAISTRTEDVRCFLKVYRNDRGAETFRSLQSLSAYVRERRRPYSVIRPISYVDELRALAIEEAVGTSLRQTLETNPEPWDELKLAAEAVAAFNQDQLPIESRHSLADRLANVENSAVLVQWACPQLREPIRMITDALARRLDEGGPAAIHGDLKPDHLFISDRRVTFIDLDRAALGDPLVDPAQLFAYMTGRLGLESAGATFVEEYFRLVPNSWRRRFPLYYAGALLEVAAQIFRRQESNWPEKIKGVIEAAQQQISEGGPE